MRLIRTLLVLTGAGVLLPSPPDGGLAQIAGMTNTDVSAFEMLTSATSAFSDVANFCQRQPGTCQTAAVVAAHLEAKAKYNARLIYEWATEEETAPPALKTPGDLPAVASDPMPTGTTEANLAAPAGGQSTLRLDDLLPEWRGPVKRAENG